MNLSVMVDIDRIRIVFLGVNLFEIVFRLHLEEGINEKEFIKSMTK